MARSVIIIDEQEYWDLVDKASHYEDYLRIQKEYRDFVTETIKNTDAITTSWIGAILDGKLEVR